MKVYNIHKLPLQQSMREDFLRINEGNLHFLISLLFISFSSEELGRQNMLAVLF